ncbi:glycoside hydrolase family 108 protein [Reyranella sp.]|uniref:glycoside hydrolase family 108 protein n=1 Tax=Reyranella sp. TaxID=1929291 RepID=UPI003D0F7DBF
MAATSFARAYKLVLVHEGGYVNHPADPGGATNKGVTQATYNAYRKGRGLATRSVREITDDELATIYRTRYWDAVDGDRLPAGLDYCVYDFGVNSGPRRGIEFLQRAVGVDDDGRLGPMTIAAVGRANVEATINRICDARLAWLRTLKHWGTFGKGWSSRVAGVRKNALAMARGSATEPVRPDPVPSRTDEAVQVPAPSAGAGKGAAVATGTIAAGGAVVAVAEADQTAGIILGVGLIIAFALVGFLIIRKRNKG